MNKRIILVGTAGVLAGAALVGVPTLALAAQGSGPAEPTASTSPDVGITKSDTGDMMADSELRDQMTSFMKEMMADPALREQMISMMSESMGDMGDMPTDGGGAGDMSDMGGMGAAG